MRKLILLFIFALTLLSLTGAQVVSSDNNFFGSRSGTARFVNHGSSFTTYYGSEANTYWPVLSNRDVCTANQDILVQVSPAGCQPAVVRSDLLAEQNVPVFCQLDLLQINPAIDIKQIRNIRFNGKYPEYVAGIGFHPAKAALRTDNQLLGSPLQNNIGYVVVVLKRNPDEKTLPKFFNFTLSASIDYYSGNAIGIGATELLLRETNDKEWEIAKNKQTLFNGKMSVRVKDTNNEDSIRVEVYSGDVKYSEIALQKNKPQSNSVYLPGSYCQTALQFSYNDFVSPSAIARIKVDEDILDVYEGARFLSNKCLVRSVSEDSIDINCGSGNIKLLSSIEVLNLGEEVHLLNDDLSVNESNKYIIRKIIKNSTGTFYDLGDKNVSISFIRPVNVPELFDKPYGEYDKFISDAIKNYEVVAQDYGGVSKDIGKEYGEVAMARAINLAVERGKRNTASRLINKYVDSYPNGENRDKFIRELNNFYIRDSSSASVSVESNDGFHLISLIDVTGAGKKSNAKISWGTQEQNIEQGQILEFNNVGTLKLLKVRDSESIEVEANCSSNVNSRDNKNFKGIVRIDNRNVVNDCGANIIISKIEFENYVKLRISPVTRSGSVANFTVGVGIEKRAIELTPDKARKKIENLNKSIAKWESISNSLGEVVTGLKTACFATAGVLTVKNFFSGLSGEALARRNVMSGEDGWTKFCQSEINAGRYEGSLTKCYNDNSDKIKKDVESRKKAIESTNSLTKEIEKNAKYPNREGVLSGENFNDSQAKRDLIDSIKRDCKAQISADKMNSLFPANQNVDVYSYTQLRDIYYNCQAINSGGSERGNKQASSELNSIGDSIGKRLEYDNGLKSLNGAGTSTGLKSYPVDVQGDSKSLTGRYFGGKLNEGDFGLKGDYKGKPAQLVYYNSQPYLAILEQKTGGDIVAEEVYKLNKDSSNNFVVGERDSVVQNKFAKFESRNPSSYNNRFAPGDETVRYFETEPYKGLPAIVPFDLNRGFYAATTQALPIFGGTKSYEDNGNPSSFFVCNVMSGGRVDYYAPNYGNDECVQFNIYTGQSFSNFPGLTEADTRKVVSEAIRALKDAASQYGKSEVKIGTNTLKVGRAASLLPGSQCQDFMSPEECKLLFNVCDPVICPASRCNFGGTYQVADVIQSGIVGSVLLCLPNIKEEIYIPICLTGVKAGIDGYLSILKSHKQCLQEAVETGKYVGICDQVSSVYLCEFFWRQAAPLAKTVIPKVVEYAYTGGQNNVRGGGEYLTVQSSWQNAQDSVEFFTQSYAVNSLNAFRVRSVEEAGTEICRAFISAKGPKTFEALVEPDSPSQFHAWYSAIDYSSATVPATSQYKVFYHIFAGNDRGVSFSVYLKDPPQNTQYANNPIVVVANGFVARGQYATESKDFTAPKGYQQLCVRINDKEECGFKQVSSSFAVNYVRDSVIVDELKRTDITSETECISGSMNPTALLNPNLQSSAEEALNPAIYNRGIVRVCATSNPGRGTNEARYVKVGVCGSDRLVCWLDKDSLDNSITSVNAGLKGKTLSEIEQIQKNNLNEKSRFENYPELKTELDIIIGRVDNVNSISIGEVVAKLDDLFNRTIWDKDRAEILFWKATAYEKAFLNSIKDLAVNIKGGGTPKISDEPQVEVPKVDSSDLTGERVERVLSFNGTYRERERNYILIGGRYTGIYIIGSRIFYINENERIGSVNDSDKRIKFLVNSKSIVDKAFIEGSYQLFIDRSITVEDIKGGNFNLDVANTITGVVECKIAGDCSEKYGEGDYICVNGYCQSTYIASETGNNIDNNFDSPEKRKRVLSFKEDYNNRAEKNIILFNGKDTEIFISGGTIYYQNKQTNIGDVDILTDIIEFSSSSEKIIKDKFGQGVYQVINKKITVENIKNGCDLNVVGSCTSVFKIVSVDSNGKIIRDGEIVSPEIYLEKIFLKKPRSFWIDPVIGAFPQNGVLWLDYGEREYIESALGKGSFDFLVKGKFVYQDLRLGIKIP